MAGLGTAGFKVHEDAGFLVVRSGDFVEAYPIRSDRTVPPKTYKRYVHKYGIPMTAFVPNIFER